MDIEEYNKLDNHTPLLDDLVNTQNYKNKELCREYQFLHDDLRYARFKLSKYKEATQSLVKTHDCGCITMNAVLLEWCGDHY